MDFKQWDAFHPEGIVRTLLELYHIVGKFGSENVW